MEGVEKTGDEMDVEETDEDDDEEGLPEIGMDELLDEFDELNVRDHEEV
jgi:nonsense-mediated mRNA decay protein 3